MVEIWEILDEKGNNTGKTIKKGTPIPNGYYHLGADIWIVNSQHQILIQKRSPQKKLSPNVWAMTGGSVIKGETSLQTIQRETFEELGIQIPIQQLKQITCFKTGNVWVDTYLLKQEIALEKIVMQQEEVCDVKWATYEEIEEMVKRGEFIEHRWEFVKTYLTNK